LSKPTRTPTSPVSIRVHPVAKTAAAKIERVKIRFILDNTFYNEKEADNNAKNKIQGPEPKVINHTIPLE
jgi:hypothetical protein